MYKGKRTCKILKEIRAQIAAENDIFYVTSECQHKGDCAGTCPKCEAEVRYLEKELEKRAKLGKAVTVAGLAATITATTLFGTSCQPQIPITERTEEFLTVEWSFTPSDFVKQSDRAIYTALKTALAEAHCLEEEERYVFLLHWDDAFQSASTSEDTITDTYQIAYHLDEETYKEQREYLHLTFSSVGALLSASYELEKYEYVLDGDMAYVPTIYTPENAQEFSTKKELLAAMQTFLQNHKHPDESVRKFVRAYWNEYYTHTRGETDYYAIETGYHFDKDGYYVREELTRPRYLALSYTDNNTLTSAVVTDTP